MDGRPLDVLEEAIDDVVTVHLKDGESYQGELSGYDQHMNLVLSASDEESEAARAAVTPVEDIMVIRGDNVVTIEP
ncbi:MAG: LSM domain-containing protein [Halobacteriaceae archaeon]